MTRTMGQERQLLLPQSHVTFAPHQFCESLFYCIMPMQPNACTWFDEVNATALGTV